MLKKAKYNFVYYFYVEWNEFKADVALYVGLTKKKNKLQQNSISNDKYFFGYYVHNETVDFH